MGQRHNRRRTRPRSRNRNVQLTPADPSLPPTTFDHFVPIESSPIATNVAIDQLSSMSDVLAPTWHQGHPAWSRRERNVRLEAGLEAQQCRLFGGVPGDDVGLCYRMLEYFGGLDYINSYQSMDYSPG
ncbi:hypothetical protein P168DRAFT_315103 [Aspergillus campestris IBT 28561]|uniref:Uncharacterized protein n=1 Tax=Aspergillus campestris (strain IBT 28561) TaxID=1392248 RepID=A0A2I1DGS2_ASPC2|nr:uncharacterized protein P168DRAFT_315103 [Aspergillus campestris IBT 28561]PKY09066.1 hypothetical protein P168DRAFT_315103 [Aspergillus campestris IBT 28561]